MAGAGWKYQHVARFDLDLYAELAAETNDDTPACDGHRLVNHRMVMRVGIDPVTPHLAPAVAFECVLDHELRIGGPLEIDPAAIDEERQARVVGHRPVVGEHQGFGRDHHVHCFTTVRSVGSHLRAKTKQMVNTGTAMRRRSLRAARPRCKSNQPGSAARMVTCSCAEPSSRRTGRTDSGCPSDRAML